MLSIKRQGTGPDVVLIHGFLSSASIFDSLASTLSQNYRVHAIDLPGFGDSRDVKVPDTIEAVAKAVQTTLATSGLEHYVLIGHSLGAMLAMQIALSDADKVDKLILYGGCAAGHVPTRFEAYEYTINRIREVGIESVAADITTKWFYQGNRDPNYAKAQAAAKGCSEFVAIDYLNIMGKWDLRSRLIEVQPSCLIICGDHDRATHPDLSIELWQHIPQAQLCILPNAGHIVHLEFEYLFSTIVGDFLAS